MWELSYQIKLQQWCTMRQQRGFSPMVQQPRSGTGLPHCQSFTITLRHTTSSRNPLDGWTARRRALHLQSHNTRDRQISIHTPGGIRTHNSSKRAAANPRLRPRGHCDQVTKQMKVNFSLEQDMKAHRWSTGMGLFFVNLGAKWLWRLYFRGKTRYPFSRRLGGPRGFSGLV